MKEVKNPKKPLAYYYSITLIALLLFNIFVAPLLNRQHVEQTDYSTFMRMIAEKKIGKVDVSDTEIVFTDKDDNTIYQSRRQSPWLRPAPVRLHCGRYCRFSGGALFHIFFTRSAIPFHNYRIQ